MNFKLNIQLFGNAVIPFDNGRNDKRDIEGLWLQALATSKALTAAIGCEFGSVLNIQDAGQKEQGKVYLDKNNGKLYKCLNTTTSVSNTTENFALFNVQQNSDRLDNLKRSWNLVGTWVPMSQDASKVVHSAMQLNSIIVPDIYDELMILMTFSSSTADVATKPVQVFKYELGTLSIGSELATETVLVYEGYISSMNSYSFHVVAKSSWWDNAMQIYAR